MAFSEGNGIRWPQGNGEMASLIRRHAWHRSGLGPVARWPPHLRTATDLMLGAAVPTLILSGSDGVVLYNDAFVPFLGSLHPALLGTALSTADPNDGARFRALALAVEAGETIVTEDNWLGLPQESNDIALSRLACSPLRNAKGAVSGVWVQVLTTAGLRSELAAEGSEATLSSSLTAAGLAAWVWSPDTGETHLTNGASDVLGLLPGQMFGSAHFDLVHPHDKAARSAALDETLATGQSYRCEFRIVRPCDQQVAWIEERGQRVRDSATGRTLMSGVLWEIGDRKRAAAGDGAGRDRYVAALDIDTVGVAFFRAGGVITEANETYCRMHGIDKMDVLAGHVRWGDGTAHEWLTLLRRSMYEYQVTGRVPPHEKECVRPDGHRWWGLFSAKRLGPGEGVEYVIDITARMLVERDLKDSERRSRTLMEGIPQIVWRADESGHWTWTSPQWTELTGQPQNQSCGLGWLEMVHPDDRGEAHSVWDRANWQQELEANYRLWHIGENRYRTFKTRATPVRDESERIVEWLGTSTDVEDLQQLQGRLQVLVAELQHRTRNLLSLVRSIAGQTIAARTENINEQYATFSERLAALSRAQSLITRTGTERVDLEGLLRSELAALRSGEGALVELLGPKVALSPTHAQALALVTHELATNAVKYGALGTPGGKLHITWQTELTRNEGQTLHLVWRERGVDIPPEREHRRGFGRELIEDALQFSLDARTDLRFCPDGVACSIALPLSNVRAAVAT